MVENVLVLGRNWDRKLGVIATFRYPERKGELSFEDDLTLLFVLGLGDWAKKGTTDIIPVKSNSVHLTVTCP